MWIDQKLKQEMLLLRHSFLLWMPTLEYTYRTSTDNKHKLDKLLSILDRISDSISSLRKSKETTLEALGHVKQEDLFERLRPSLEEKFAFKLSILPRIGLKEGKVYKEDESKNVIDADLIFEVQGNINDTFFTAEYPIFIVDGYIKDPEIVNYLHHRYSLKDFVNLITSDKYRVQEPVPMLQYINERGNNLSALWSEEGENLESALPTNHTWTVYKYR